MILTEIREQVSPLRSNMCLTLHQLLTICPISIPDTVVSTVITQLPPRHVAYSPSLPPPA
jgi:hypothetical protein